MHDRFLRGFRDAQVEAGATGGAPTGPAGGDLSGTYPNPTVGPAVKKFLTPANKGMAAQVTAADNALATLTALASTPAPTAWLTVFINGISYKIGNGTRVGVPCYFSADSGVTARGTGTLVAGDLFYWNGSVAGFQLDASDRIDFEYEA